MKVMDVDVSKNRQREKRMRSSAEGKQKTTRESSCSVSLRLFLSNLHAICIILPELAAEPPIRFHTSILTQEDEDGSPAATAERPKMAGPARSHRVVWTGAEIHLEGAPS